MFLEGAPRQDVRFWFQCNLLYYPIASSCNSKAVGNCVKQTVRANLNLRCEGSRTSEEWSLLVRVRSAPLIATTEGAGEVRTLEGNTSDDAVEIHFSENQAVFVTNGGIGRVEAQVQVEQFGESVMTADRPVDDGQIAVGHTLKGSGAHGCRSGRVGRGGRDRLRARVELVIRNAVVKDGVSFHGRAIAEFIGDPVSSLKRNFVREGGVVVPNVGVGRRTTGRGQPFVGQA